MLISMPGVRAAGRGCIAKAYKAQDLQQSLTEVKGDLQDLLPRSKRKVLTYFLECHHCTSNNQLTICVSACVGMF